MCALLQNPRRGTTWNRCQWWLWYTTHPYFFLLLLFKWNLLTVQRARLFQCLYTHIHTSIWCVLVCKKPLFHFLIKRKGSSSQFSKSCKFRGQLVCKLNECRYGHSECSSHEDVPSCHKHRNNIIILQLHYTWSYIWETCTCSTKLKS